jgi:hypothetical protein
MKKIRNSLLLFIFIFCISAHSQDKGFGLGIIIGEPTGISLKAWMSKTSAVDAGLAWSFVNEGSAHIHVDYLHHIYDVIKIESGKLPLYVGIGGRIKIKNNKGNNDNRVGIRIPLGIDYMFASAPVDIFLEIAPILDLTPETKISVNGGLGFRYFFN